MRAWPWLVGGGALAYALTRRRAHEAPRTSANVEPFTGTLPGRWVWPVPRWNGRSAVVSDGFNSPNINEVRRMERAGHPTRLR